MPGQVAVATVEEVGGESTGLKIPRIRKKRYVTSVSIN